jgi:hypothetical protein
MEPVEKLNGDKQHNALWSRDTGDGTGVGPRGRGTRPVTLHFSLGSLIVENEQKVTFRLAAAVDHVALPPGPGD